MSMLFLGLEALLTASQIREQLSTMIALELRSVPSLEVNAPQWISWMAADQYQKEVSQICQTL
jgi:hypothetical protein